MRFISVRVLLVVGAWVCFGPHGVVPLLYPSPLLSAVRSRRTDSKTGLPPRELGRTPQWRNNNKRCCLVWGVRTALAATTTTPPPPASEDEQQTSSRSFVTPLPTEQAFANAVNGTAADRLVVVKFYAPWCRACRGLEPKFKRLSVEYQKKGGVDFYEMSHKDVAATEGGTEFLQRNEVNVLPLVHFYARGQRVEAFPCGPRKIELLREKLEKWHRFDEKQIFGDHAFGDAATKSNATSDGASETTAAPTAAGALPEEPVSAETTPRATTSSTAERTATTTTTGEEPFVSAAQPQPEKTEPAMTAQTTAPPSTEEDDDVAPPMKRPTSVRSVKEGELVGAVARAALSRVPAFKGLTEEQATALVKGARVATYEPGDVLVAEGEVGRRFFVLLSGECDVYQESKVVAENRLSGFSPDATRTAFGVRTNILSAGAYFGERSLVENTPRAASIVAATDVKALAIERSVLRAADVLEALKEENRNNDSGSQQTPKLWGYERTKVVKGLSGDMSSSSRATTTKSLAAAPQQTPTLFASADLSVMQRLRLVRSCVRAFEQAASRAPSYGDAGEIAYRQRLLAQLTPQQRHEFEQTFSLLDKNGDGVITLDELTDLMTAFGRDQFYTPTDLSEMLNKANPEEYGNDRLTRDDFLALMAQAEFSAMFLETFKLLDPLGIGFLESEQLWRVIDALLGADFPNLDAYDTLVQRFGQDDGHIDYAAFVRILMSSGPAV